MLVAELARVWKLVGGQRSVARDARGDAGEEALLRPPDEMMTMEAASSRIGDDVGEAVEREPELEAPSVDAGPAAASSMAAAAAAGAMPSEPSSIEKTKTRPKSPPRATRRQRKQSAKGKKGSSVIDDIFRGLD